MNYKYALNSLLKKTMFSVLTVIQLVAIVMLLYTSISYKLFTSEKINIVNKIFPKENVYHLQLEVPPDLKSIDTNKTEKVKDFIDTEIEVISIDGGALKIESDRILQSNKLPLDNQIINDTTFSAMYGYKANENFFKQEYLKCIEGDLNQVDFKKGDGEIVDVVLGYEFSGKVNIGDKIKFINRDEEGNDTVREMKVAAILAKDSYVSASTVVNDFSLVDNSIIVPFSNNESNIKSDALSYNGYVFSYLQNAYFNIEDEIKVNELQTYLDNSGFEFKIISLDTTISEFKDNMKKSIQPINSVFILIIIFTGISIVTSMISMIIKSIKEYAVHLLLGCTIKDIIIRIILEINTLFVISYTLGLAMINTLFNQSEIYCLNIKYAISCGIILLIFMLITLLFPVLKIKKYSIEELIRSE